MSKKKKTSELNTLIIEAKKVAYRAHRINKRALFILKVLTDQKAKYT